MRDVTRLARVWVPLMWLVALASLSCGNIVVVGPEGTLVGAPCTVDGQCDKTCLIDDRHFPSGMCTVPCTTDAECPSGSVCVAHNGGQCVFACAGDTSCQGFGRGYVCGSSERAAGGTASVCLVP